MTKDQDYEAAVEKGIKLLQMLTRKTRTSHQSAFNHPEELAQHDYLSNPQQTDFEIESVAAALRDLNVDDSMVYDGGENVRIHHTHESVSIIEREEYSVRPNLSQD